MVGAPFFSVAAIIAAAEVTALVVASGVAPAPHSVRSAQQHSPSRRAHRWCRRLDRIVTRTGCVVVLAVGVVASVLVEQLAPPQRALRVLRATAGVSLAGYLLHVHVAARVGGGLSALLSLGELRALYVTFAIALVPGMRLAFSESAGTHRHESRRGALGASFRSRNVRATCA
jgi:hypothetical protein